MYVERLESLGPHICFQHSMPLHSVETAPHLWSQGNCQAWYRYKARCSVQSLSCVRLFVTPWTAAHQAPPVLHYLPEFAQTHVRWVSDAIQPSHPVSSPSPPTSILPSIRVFFNELALCIRCRGGISQPRNVFIEILPVKPTSSQGNIQDLTFSFYLSTLVSVAKASGR